MDLNAYETFAKAEAHEQATERQRNFVENELR